MPPAHRRLLGAALVAVLFLTTLFAGVLPASAGEPIAIVEDAVLVGKPGELKNLATVDVDPAYVGSTCTITVHSENQSSVHPGNDLVITSGDDEAVIEDVEAEANGAKDLSAQFTLGPSISIDLRFGEDYISSLGFQLDLDCGTDATIIVVDPCAVEGSGNAGGSGGTGPTTTLPEECGPQVEPTVIEASTTSTTEPNPCPDVVDDGALTIDEDGCPVPTTTTTVPPTTTAPPTTAPPTTTTTAPTTTSSAPPATGNATGDTTTTTAGTGATVKGIQVEAGQSTDIPAAEAATAVPAAPAYTG